VLLACDADPSVRARIRRELGDTGVPADATAQILAAVQRAGGVDQARARAAALAEEAIASLVTVPASPHKEALAEIARLSVHRVT
jgi:octaprenyl-diphosphate synthase